MAKTKKQAEVKIAEIDFTVEKDNIVFEVGKQKFSISREKVAVLLGREEEYKHSRAALREDIPKSVAEIETVRNAVVWSIMKKRGFSHKEVAREMNASVEDMLRWANTRAATISRLLNQSPGQVELIEAELAEKYPESESKMNPVDLVRFDLKKARRLILEDKLSFPAAAQEMGITSQEFSGHWQRNLKTLQKKIGG